MILISLPPDGWLMMVDAVQPGNCTTRKDKVSAMTSSSVSSGRRVDQVL